MKVYLFYHQDYEDITHFGVYKEMGDAEEARQEYARGGTSLKVLHIEELDLIEPK